ncbi:unnamed protein product [Rhizophagus irregularis]|nr:unnamed protein product [Rhizophagus irregularis]
MTHHQAVYTSRLLDFKNLPEPKNADNNDDLHGIEYSDSLIIDFTKQDINSKDEIKNADNNDDLHGIEYSDSFKMDFTKLDINSKDESN